MKNQFSKINYDLFQIEELTITDIVVYGFIESLTNNEKGYCFASNNKLVEISGGKICSRTIQRSLRRLEKAELITVEVTLYSKEESIKADRKIYCTPRLKVAHPVTQSRTPHDLKSPTPRLKDIPPTTQSRPPHDLKSHIIDNSINNLLDKKIDKLTDNRNSKILPEDLSSLTEKIKTIQGKKEVLIDFFKTSTEDYSLLKNLFKSEGFFINEIISSNPDTSTRNKKLYTLLIFGKNVLHQSNHELESNEIRLKDLDSILSMYVYTPSNL